MSCPVKPEPVQRQKCCTTSNIDSFSFWKASPVCHSHTSSSLKGGIHVSFKVIWWQDVLVACYGSQTAFEEKESDNQLIAYIDFVRQLIVHQLGPLWLPHTYGHAETAACFRFPPACKVTSKASSYFSTAVGSRTLLWADLRNGSGI